MTPVQRRKAATAFRDKWQNADPGEKQHTQQFWTELMNRILEIATDSDHIQFEKPVFLDHQSYIDAYIPGPHPVLIEQKGPFVDLGKKERQSDGSYLNPYEQAKRYADWLPKSEKPDYIIVSNFREFRIYDQENPKGEPVIFHLKDLPKQYPSLRILSSETISDIDASVLVSKEAARLIGKLYDALLKAYGDQPTSYDLEQLNKLCTRLVFCMYAEDAGLFGEEEAFFDYLKDAAPEDMNEDLSRLFKVLDTPVAKRPRFLSPRLARFPYVNGALFSGEIEIPPFSEETKHMLLYDTAHHFDWKDISPTVFGALFESTLNPELRRSSGMHYTSVESIHKLIDPLFLDDLKAELEEIRQLKQVNVRNRRAELFQKKLAGLRFLDPACGSGNFLTESYICLRRLENEAIKLQLTDKKLVQAVNKLQMVLDADVIKVSIQQFYGIEINNFAVSVATTALYIAEAQLYEETQEIAHFYDNFLPLHSYAHIHEGNALTMDWNSVIPASELNYIMGNPPFLGARNQSKEQKSQIQAVFQKAKNCGNVDLCAAWFKKAADYMKDTSIHSAFVATNSICQGEQVANIWYPLYAEGIRINFAYDTFRWKNDSDEQAHVFCIIVGFSYAETPGKLLFHHENPDAHPIRQQARNINAYLSDAPDIFIYSRNKPLCAVPDMSVGNKPIDGGYYIFTEEEKQQFLKKEPGAKAYFHPFIGAKEFLHGNPRWILYLGQATWEDLKNLPMVRERIRQVRDYRLASRSAPTRKLADHPQNYHIENIPKGNSIVIPEVSSERRRYIPVDFLEPGVLCSNLVKLIPEGSLYEFGVLQSQIHNAWMRAVAGRLKGDYRYSIGIVYNNFPWPAVTPEQRKRVENAAQDVLEARKHNPSATLAELYDPDNSLFFPELMEAHQRLDQAVEAAYGWRTNGDEEKILQYLFRLYDKLEQQDKLT